MIQLSVTVTCDHDDGIDYCEAEFTTEPPGGRIDPRQAGRQAAEAVATQLAGRGWVADVSGDGGPCFYCPLHRFVTEAAGG